MSFTPLVLFVTCGGALSAGVHAQAPVSAPAPVQASPATRLELELVESAPLETELDNPDLRNTTEVWLEMVGRARRSLDLAHFYASDQAPSSLTRVIEAIESAAARGVKVRFLAEEKFYATYPQTLDRLARLPGAQVRRFDVAKSYGGVLHAKYFVVDGEEVFLGSQNFDWRALEHIVELGLRLRAPGAAASFQTLFEADWQVAGAADAKAVFAGLAELPAPSDSIDGASVRYRFSPRSALPNESWWDLPLLVEWIDSAQRNVDVQLLTYKSITRAKEYWDELESALRRAAARGAQVRLLVADWGKRKGTIEGLQSLEPLANFEVRMVTVPAHSSGHVPFARVIHSKYMVVDGARLWLGTSNWERDYFEQSRNASVFIEGGAAPARTQRYFERLWTASCAYRGDPSAQYQAPRVGD
jgi:phosphatidylserine/phosphatidylglycerophosphate/cardiolipin synthase-like enzyme